MESKLLKLDKFEHGYELFKKLALDILNSGEPKQSISPYYADLR